MAIGIWIAGCVENDRTLLIRGATGFADDCSVNISETDFLASGVLDMAPAYGPTFPLRYYNGFLVQNFLFNTSVNGSVDTNKVVLEQVRVRLEWLRGKQIPDPTLQSDLRAIENSPEQVFPVSAIVDSSTEGKPGSYWVSMKLLDSVDIDPTSPGLMLTNFFSDSNNLEFVDNLILGLKIQIEGSTTGGSTVTSNEFVFPLQFCVGCLAVARNGNVPVYTCCADTPSLTDDYFPYCGGIQDRAPECDKCDITSH
jgi:hypothetical protein